MENNLQLRVTCNGFTVVELDDIADLQGNLKSLSEKDEVKLRNSLITYGFSFPIFYWEDETGKKWSIDSHQRRLVLHKMREEGWNIPPLPADPVFALDKVEAKKKLLLVDSRYGRVNKKGLEAFIREPEAVVDIEELTPLLDLPEIKFDFVEKREKEKQLLKCPNCAFEFERGVKK